MSGFPPHPAALATRWRTGSTSAFDPNALLKSGIVVTQDAGLGVLPSGDVLIEELDAMAGLSPEQEGALFNAALTMNLAMARLQEDGIAYAGGAQWRGRRARRRARRSTPPARPR